MVGAALLAPTAIPAQADASTYLSNGEASRQLGATVHGDYYVARGSLRVNWYRREASNRLYGYYTVRFQDGDYGWGRARVTEWPSSYRTYYSINY